MASPFLLAIEMLHVCLVPADLRAGPYPVLADLEGA
jgi:hypothetical protein